MFRKTYQTRVTKLAFGGILLLALWRSLLAETPPCGEEIYFGVLEGVQLNPFTAEKTPTVGTGKTIDENYCSLILNASTSYNSHCHAFAGANEYTCFSHFEPTAITPKSNFLHTAQAYYVHDFFMTEMLSCIDDELVDQELVAIDDTSTIKMDYKLKNNSTISVKLDMCMDENSLVSRISIETRYDK